MKGRSLALCHINQKDVAVARLRQALSQSSRCCGYAGVAADSSHGKQFRLMGQVSALKIVNQAITKRFMKDPLIVAVPPEIRNRKQKGQAQYPCNILRPADRAV